MAYHAYKLGNWAARGMIVQVGYHDAQSYWVDLRASAAFAGTEMTERALCGSRLCCTRGTPVMVPGLAGKIATQVAALPPFQLQRNLQEGRHSRAPTLQPCTLAS